MAIRFRCQRCNQLLGIASRKAGHEIACPKCGVLQTVPSEEAAAAALAMRQIAVRQEADAASQVVVYEDEPTAIDTPRRATDVGPATPPPPAAARADVAAAENMVAYSRQTLYLQGVLFAALGVTAFVGGYFAGRGDASASLQRAAEEASRQRVLVDGRVVFDPGSGALEGDQDAVVIALPEEKMPEQTLSIKGLRPRDPMPAADQDSVRAIEKLGGAYAKADPTGAFSLVLPAEAKYHLLIVSRNTERPDDEPIDELDLDQIQAYFYRAADLIGRHKYRWTVEELHAEGESITQDFGISGHSSRNAELGLTP